MPAEREQLIIGGKEYPFWSGPDSWAKAAHNPSVIKAINTDDPYPVRALYVSGVNIVCTYPGMQDTIAALKRLDLLVVATDHITPTAELADFVLPKTTLLEEEAVFQDPGAACISVIQAALPPQGEVKTDLEIAISLRDRLKMRNLLDFDLLPWNSNREFIDFQLEKTGLDFDKLRADGFYEYSANYEKFRKTGFNTPSKKIELCPSKLSEAGYDPLPDYISAVYPESDSSFSLTLLTGIRTMAYHHSRFRNHRWARKRQNEPELRVHPKTAERFGIREDDWVKVETPRGSGAAYLKAWITDEVPEDIVATGMGWWYPEIKGADRGALKLNVEAAIPYGPPWDLICGSAEARNCACRISRADLAQIPEELMTVRERA
jgi:anaerobic selenocysteine-containing dehydrogenase